MNSRISVKSKLKRLLRSELNELLIKLGYTSDPEEINNIETIINYILNTYEEEEINRALSSDMASKNDKKRWISKYAPYFAIVSIFLAVLIFFINKKSSKVQGELLLSEVNDIEYNIEKILRNQIKDGFELENNIENSVKLISQVLNDEMLPDTVKIELENRLLQNGIDSALLFLSNFQTATYPLNSIIYFQKGRLYEAELDYNSALKSYGIAVEIDSNNYKFLNKRGILLNKIGRHKEAIVNFEKALKLADSKGLVDSTIAPIYNNIGATYLEIDSFKLAEEKFDTAIELVKKSIIDHPVLGRYYSNIGYSLQKQGRFDEALEFYNSSLRHSLKVGGLINKDVATAYNNLGDCYMAIGEYKKGKENFSSAYDIFIDLYSSNHPMIAGCLNNMGLAELKLGDFDNSRKHLYEALVLFEKLYGENHVTLEKIYTNLGAIEFNEKNYEMAIKYFNKAFDINMFLSRNKASINTALISSNLGTAYQKISELKESIKWFKKSLRLYEEIARKDDLLYGLACINMSKALLELGDVDEALFICESGVSVYQTKKVNNHPAVGAAYSNLGDIMVAKNKKDKAKIYFEKAYDIFANHSGYGVKHDKTISIKKALEELFE